MARIEHVPVPLKVKAKREKNPKAKTLSISKATELKTAKDKNIRKRERTDVLMPKSDRKKTERCCLMHGASKEKECLSNSTLAHVSPICRDKTCKSPDSPCDQSPPSPCDQSPPYDGIAALRPEELDNLIDYHHNLANGDIAADGNVYSKIMQLMEENSHGEKTTLPDLGFDLDLDLEMKLDDEMCKRTTGRTTSPNRDAINTDRFLPPNITIAANNSSACDNPSSSLSRLSFIFYNCPKRRGAILADLRQSFADYMRLKKSAAAADNNLCDVSPKRYKLPELYQNKFQNATSDHVAATVRFTDRKAPVYDGRSLEPERRNEATVTTTKVFSNPIITRTQPIQPQLVRCDTKDGVLQPVVPKKRGRPRKNPDAPINNKIAKKNKKATSNATHFEPEDRKIQPEIKDTLSKPAGRKRKSDNKSDFNNQFQDTVANPSIDNSDTAASLPPSLVDTSTFTPHFPLIQAPRVPPKVAVRRLVNSKDTETDYCMDVAQLPTSTATYKSGAIRLIPPLQGPLFADCTASTRVSSTEYVETVLMADGKRIQLHRPICARPITALPAASSACHSSGSFSVVNSRKSSNNRCKDSNNSGKGSKLCVPPAIYNGVPGGLYSRSKYVERSCTVSAVPPD